MSPPKLVVLYGPDGVGKSTHVEILMDILRSRGYKVRIVWLRGPHTLAFLLSKMLMKAGRKRSIVNPAGRVKTLPLIGSNRIGKQVWAFIEFISVLPLILIKVIIPLKLGYIIVADRYVFDVIISTSFYIDDLSFVDHRLAKLLKKLIPPDSLLIHLDTDYNTLRQRRGDSVEAQVFIDFQKRGYERLSEGYETHYIDTSKLTIDETSKAILKIVEYYNQQTKLDGRL